MAVEVVMPQLGMAQETGVIARWCCEVGDQLQAGDVIMEVETDKTVMEVEAREAGCLARVLHAAGAEVPVGAVVAVIDDGVAAPAVAAPSTPPPAKTAPTPAVAAPAIAPPAPARQEVAPAAGDRILASPKARATSARLGVSLQALRDAGVGQPFHHADVEKFAAGAAASDTLAAEVDAQAFAAFLELAREGHPEVGIKEVLCAFAIGAWRASAGADDCAVSYLEPGQAASSCRLGGTGAILALAETSASPAFLLHNLAGNLVGEYRAAGGDTLPVLTVSGQGARLRAQLRFRSLALPVDRAVTFLESFARRLHDPRYHLL